MPRYGFLLMRLRGSPVEVHGLRPRNNALFKQLYDLLGHDFVNVHFHTPVVHLVDGGEPLSAALHSAARRELLLQAPLRCFRFVASHETGFVGPRFQFGSAYRFLLSLRIGGGCAALRFRLRGLWW